MRSEDGEHNTIIGAGNIIKGGNIRNSPMTNVVQDQQVRVSAPSSAEEQHPVLEQLRDELERIRLLLANAQNQTAIADRDDAMESIVAVQGVVASQGAGDSKGLRMRVKGLIGVLLPVADIIGGVAALQAICQHL